MRQAIALFVCVVSAGSIAYAADDVACWYRGLEEIDYVTNPPQGGDNQFFTNSDVPPNLIWVLDTSGSMQGLPCGSCGSYDRCGTGFTSTGNNYFRSKGWKGFLGLAQAYDAFDPDRCSDPANPRSWSENDGCYDPQYLYHFNSTSCKSWSSSAKIWSRVNTNATPQNWCRDNYLEEQSAVGKSCSAHSQCDSGAGFRCLNSSGGTSGSRNCRQPTTCTSDSACGQGFRCLTSSGASTGSGRACRVPSDCTLNGSVCQNGYTCNPDSKKCEKGEEDVLACVDHLNTYGYHPNPSNSNVPVFMGDVLNFYPAKFVVARQVIKETVRGSGRLRQALMTFGSGTIGGKVEETYGPMCSHVMGESSYFDSIRESIATKIYSAEFSGGTPLGETLTSACQYVAGSKSRFENQVKVRSQTGVGTGNSTTNVPESSASNDSVCYTCQRNFVVVLTDGEPSTDAAVPCALRNYDQDCKEGLRNTPSCSSSSSCPASEKRFYTSGGTDGFDYFDDVAAFCYNEDMRPDMPGKQNVVVHTVGFDVSAPILADAASAGGGLYIEANDASELRSALSSIVSDVNRRATSFSVASVTTVQTRGSTYAFVPRFRPAAEDLWEGHLYRFKLFNEFSAGCNPGDTTGTLTAAQLARNPNGDGDCGDVYLVDADGNFIGENNDGDYVQLDTTQDWVEGSGWPAKMPNVPAVPVWNASEKLRTRDLVNDPRRIFTVVDQNGDGVLAPDEQIEFTPDNAALIAPTLGLGGLSSPVCSELATRQAKVYANVTECAADLIRFVRGHDVLDEDRDGNFTEARPKILGDIFHSSPMLVTAPAPPFLCDLGLVSQCVFSLYSTDLTPGGEAAYKDYVEEQKERDQFVLVGSNDGMVHAFHAGAFQTGDDPETPEVESSLNEYFDLGTGVELWAFVAPEMLPKLKRLAVHDGRHDIFVDGTAMVRDVWVDSIEQPGVKNAEEYRTMAVIGMRQGGRSWLGLDVTDPENPGFRWSFPGRGDVSALEGGETWNDIAPGAPPIGPVALAKSGGPVGVGGVSAEERWAVFLNGGFDTNMLRGRSVHALDVWTGKPIWRFAASDAGSSDPRRFLASVAAPVAMLDLGATSTTRGIQDGLFDTVVAADLMGQVWTLRLHEPGTDDDGDGLVDNWTGARAFTQFSGSTIKQRSPFFQLPEITVSPETGDVRVHLGSGDRAQIRQMNGGACGPMNLSACIRKGCTVSAQPSASVDGYAAFGDDQVAEGQWAIQPTWTAVQQSTDVETDDDIDYCEQPVEGGYLVRIQCGTSSLKEYDWAASCSWDETTGAMTCPVRTPKPDPGNATVASAASSTPSRFYTFNLWGGVAGRLPFVDWDEAKTYDDAHLTDTHLANADVNPGDSQIGWYVQYAHQDERTASAASVLGGCVVWNTLQPDLSTIACGGAVADVGRGYRGQFASGTVACGTLPDGNRATARTAIVPPPPPTPVVAFNARTGEVRYSMISIEPGSAPIQQSVGAGELAGPIYWMEVPREVHACRHGGNCE